MKKDIGCVDFDSHNLIVGESEINRILDEILLKGFNRISSYDKYILSKYSKDYILYKSITLMDIYRDCNNSFPKNLHVKIHPIPNQTVKDYSSREYENKIGIIENKIQLNPHRVQIVEVNFNPNRKKVKPVKIPMDNLFLI